MTLRTNLLAGSIVAAIAFTGTATAQTPAAQSATDSVTVPSKPGIHPAPTKQKPKQLQTVIVTGTNIPESDLATAQPVLTLTEHDIQATGQITAGSVLQQLPVVALDPLNRQSVNDGHPQEGGEFANLRNLGASRTLVLVNGHRWATDRDGEVDLSSIPSAVIERIDVLNDGASAIYGSDAIAGVVNIITKNKFNGLQANVYYGQNADGDGTNQQYSVLFGSTTDKSSFLMSISQTNEGAVLNKKRNLTRYPDGPYHPTDGWSLESPAGKFAYLTPSGGIGDVYALNALGDDTSNLSNYHLYNGSLSDQFNPTQYGMTRLPIKGNSLYMQETYNITNNLQFNITADYTQRKTNNSSGAGAGVALSPYSFPGNIPGVANLTGLISPDSIYNPTGQSVAFFTDITGIPAVVRTTVNTKHVDGGLNGSFNLGQQNWTWNANVDFNAQDYDIDNMNGMNLENVQNAIGPSFLSSGGTPMCGTPSDVISGCIPWNALAGPSGMTSALRSYLFVSAPWQQFTRTTVYSANAAGGLFDIPLGGTVALALGVDRQYQAINTHLDPLVQSGVTTFSAPQPTSGHYSVNEAYWELSVPLLENLPGAYSLGFDFAGRYSNYSTFGGQYNGKYSFTWQPIEDLLVRGGFAQSFRSPSLNDMFGGSSRFSVYLLDPCDAEYGAQVYGSAIHNACVSSLATAAPGVQAASFRQLDGAGKPITTPSPIPPLLVNFSSNPNLGPETSDTRTLGFVYSPHYLHGLNVGVDWFRTTIWNAVTLPDPNLIMQFCYEGQAASCTFTRDPATGQLSSFSFGYMNLGKLITQGYDVTANYAFPESRFGDFQLRMMSTYLQKYGTQSAPGAPMQWAVGWSESGVANWRLRSNVAIDWHRGNIGATWTLRYFSSLREPCQFSTECNQPNYISPVSGLSPANRDGAIAFNDLNVHMILPWKGTVSVGVNDIFDRRSPVMYSSLSNSGSVPLQGAYDLDRYFYVSYQQTF